MTTATRLLATSLWVAALTSAALAFDCPDEVTVSSPQLAPIIASLIPAGDDLVVHGELDSAVDLLRGHGVPDDEVVNSLFAAYCPRIAGNAALDETEKNDRANAFLTEAKRVVYDGGGD